MRILILTTVAVFAVLQATQPRIERRDASQRLPGIASDAAADREEDLAVRLAETKLQLGELELRQAAERNRRNPGTFPNVTLERLENAVKIYKRQLEFSKGTKDDLHTVHLLQLEAEVELANRQLQTTTAASRRAPGVISATDLERLRLQSEVARLSLARAREPSSFKSMHAHLQWQIDRLHEEIQRLKNEVDILSLRK